MKAAPWPLRADAHIFDVVLVVISGFAVQQIGGQLWRVFFTRVPEQARALLVLYPRFNSPCNAYITFNLCQVQLYYSRNAGIEVVCLQEGKHCRSAMTGAVLFGKSSLT